MEKKTQEINLNMLGKTILRRAWIIVLAVIICGAGMFVYAKNYVTPTYKASVQLYVNNTSELAAEGKYIPYSELTAAQSLVKTYVAILDTYDTIREVVACSGLDYSYEQMRSMLSAEAINETELFEVSVVAESPEHAATLADAVATVLPVRIAMFVEGSSVAVVQRAVLPTSPYAPNLVKYTLTGTLVGLFISLVAIVVVELVDNRIKEEEYVSEQYGTRTLAFIPDLLGASGKSKSARRDAENQSKMLCDNLGFSAIEAYKMLRTNLMSVTAGKEDLKAFGVTSPEPCDGKSTLAINFAYTLAQTGKKVLLIEADMRKPVVAKRLQLSNNGGLSDILLGKDGDFIKPSGQLENWDVLCSGKIVENSSELLGSDKMRALMAACREIYDFIVVDLPPVNLVSDAIVASDVLDGMMLTVRLNKTTKMSLENAMGQLEYLNTNLVGFVVTDAKPGGKYGRYGKYSHSYYKKDTETNA